MSPQEVDRIHDAVIDLLFEAAPGILEDANLTRIIVHIVVTLLRRELTDHQHPQEEQAGPTH